MSQNINIGGNHLQQTYAKNKKKISIRAQTDTHTNGQADGRMDATKYISILYSKIVHIWVKKIMRPSVTLLAIFFWDCPHVLLVICFIVNSTESMHAYA